jgi:hypothetical protein
MGAMSRSAAQGQDTVDFSNVAVMPVRNTRMLAYRTPPVIEIGHLMTNHTLGAGQPDDDDGDDLLALAPVPIATGTVHRDEHGALVQVAQIEVVLTLASGARHVIPLQAQHGAWWAPSTPAGR